MHVNTIIQTDALSGLRSLPDECIDMVITSPPYWALRYYGDAVKTIWGGSKDCTHDWQPRAYKQHAGRGTASEVKAGKYSAQKPIPDAVRTDETCTMCGAWRGQLGQEPTVHLFVDHLLEIFAEVKRVLKPTGSCWVNLGDTYNGGGGYSPNAPSNLAGSDQSHRRGCIAKPRSQMNYPKKSLCCIPDRFKVRMVDELGFTCRNELIWYKPNSMPQSVKDRFAVDFEKIYFFTKQERYYFDTQYEPLSQATLDELAKLYNGKATKDYAAAGAQDPSAVKARIVRGFMNKQGTAHLQGQNEQRHGKNLSAALAQKYSGLLLEQLPAQPTLYDYAGIVIDSSPALMSKDGSQQPSDQKIRAALALGWRPELHTYADWYYNIRAKKGWHDHTDDATRGNSRKGRNSKESNVALHHPLGRVKRSVWKIPVRPFAGAHFAVFPEQLIETPIKAGCPALICTRCGKPALSQYQTVAQVNTRPGRERNETRKSGKSGDPHSDFHNSAWSRYRQTPVRQSTGLKPGCKCEGAEVTPGIVLDPFMGAGTTAVVAQKLGRHWLGFELNPEYIKLAQQRLAAIDQQS